ncbi:fumarylacetoacetate hydrolase family protein [Nocardioides sp.]|uniref:fumarylacetoacetate hydrolase family protein n=1 Tax=Nocardioides sp. TaxID=35761 RepID=UPI0039E56C7C
MWVDTASGLAVDIAKASGARFGPEPAALYDAWPDFVGWAATVTPDFAADGTPFVASEADAPSPAPRQVFAIGLNYKDHADESGFSYPPVPTVFTKFVGSFAGPEGTLVLPNDTVDWEAELVVVIGRPAKDVARADAWEYVAGLTVGQDYSERTLQLSGPAPQFSLGKSYPGFAPQGPYLTTVDELAEPADLEIACTVNGEQVQGSRTSRLIFDIPTLIEHLSGVVQLYPGDVIFTGTPAGVGGAREPKWFLKDGDVVETTIEGLGSLRQTCASQR